MTLSFAQIQQFKIDGYLVLPSLLKSSEVDHLRSLTKKSLSNRTKPYELEAEVNYPGAPASTNAKKAAIPSAAYAWPFNVMLASLNRHAE